MPFKPSGASLVDVARETQDTGFGPGQAAAGGVTSVAGRTGVVTLTEADIASLVADLAAKLVKASNLSDLTDAAAARTNLGLGTAATHATGDYDAAGAAAAVAAAARLQRGTYAAGTAYAVGDLAFYQGALYVCIQAGAGHTPSTSATFWTAIAGDTGWTGFAYVNSWVDFGAPYPGARYRKNAFGIVLLDGVAKDGAHGTQMSTLPAGYRPSASFLVGIETQSTTGPNLSKLYIESNGNVSVLDQQGATYVAGTGSGFFAALSGVAFLAEN